MEEIKQKETTATASQADCCQSGLEVKGRQIGMKSVLIVSGIFIFALLLLTGMFVLYATLNGITLSVIFLIYTRASIASTFFICAATFIACSIYGMTTKRDLTSLGSFMVMGLFGIIIASVVNLFIRSSGMSLIISYIGVFVFIGLTAYDTQKLKTMALSQPSDLEARVVRKGAILGALTLYLNFINLFLMLLRILGTGRDSTSGNHTYPLSKINA